MKVQNKKEIQLSFRNEELLNFLWQWKLCTTAGIATKFYLDNPVWAYNRLLELSKAGFVQSIAIDKTGKRFVWSLDQMGYHQVIYDVETLKEKGWLSETPKHDLLVTAMHLGDWLTGAPVGVEFFTEQELRRKKDSLFLHWVPKMPLHRPDGYWLIPNGQTNLVFALEVEASTKDFSEYPSVGKAYRDTDIIKRVFWLVESERNALQIQQKFMEVSPEKFERHNFILLGDFKKCGWDAKVILGYEKEKNIRHAICAGQESLIEATLKPHCSFNAASTIDARKCPFKTTNYRSEYPNGFSNRMALQPYSDSHSKTLLETSSQTSNTVSKTNSNTFSKEENNNE